MPLVLLSIHFYSLNAEERKERVNGIWSSFIMWQSAVCSQLGFVVRSTSYLCYKDGRLLMKFYCHCKCRRFFAVMIVRITIISTETPLSFHVSVGVQGFK